MSRWIIAVIAAVALTAWVSGRLDPALSSIGLNKETCVQNAFGAKFCGEDAKRLCREFGGEACGSLGLPTKGNLQREIEQQQDKIQRDLDAALDSYSDPYSTSVGACIDDDGDGYDDVNGSMC